MKKRNYTNYTKTREDLLRSIKALESRLGVDVDNMQSGDSNDKDELAAILDSIKQSNASNGISTLHTTHNATLSNEWQPNTNQTNPFNNRDISTESNNNQENASLYHTIGIIVGAVVTTAGVIIGLGLRNVWRQKSIKNNPKKNNKDHAAHAENHMYTPEHEQNPIFRDHTPSRNERNSVIGHIYEEIPDNHASGPETDKDGYLKPLQFCNHNVHPDFKTDEKVHLRISSVFFMKTNAASDCKTDEDGYLPSNPCCSSNNTNEKSQYSNNVSWYDSPRDANHRANDNRDIPDPSAHLKATTHAGVAALNQLVQGVNSFGDTHHLGQPSITELNLNYPISQSRVGMPLYHITAQV